MTYDTALAVAEKAIQNLKHREENTSQMDMICDVSALDYALIIIAKRGGITLPDRKAGDV